MEYTFKKFFTKLEEKKESDLKNEELEKNLKTKGSYHYIHSFEQKSPVINFYVHLTEYYPGIILAGNNSTELFKLDEEDLNYFKNKYNYKLEEEYNKNLMELNYKYNINKNE